MRNPEMGQNDPIEQEELAIARTEQEMSLDFELLERSRRFGEQYVSVIENLVGEKKSGEATQGNFDIEGKIFSKIRSVIKKHTAEVEKTIAERNLTTKDLLEASTHLVDTEEKRQLISDSSKYHMKKLSSGMYVVYMNQEARYSLSPHNNAMAVVNSPVPYILIGDMSKDDNQEYAKRQERENLFHEAEHILWNYLEQDGFLDRFNTEENPWVRVFFSHYKDEVVAHLCSNGDMIGYAPKMAPQAKDKFEKEYPGDNEKINNKIIQLNAILEDMENCIYASTVSKQDLIGCVIESATFDELAKNLENMSRIIKAAQKPIEEQPFDPLKV